MRTGKPLINAARDGRAADVAALLAGGADVNEPNLNGVTPLYIACQEGHYPPAVRWRVVELMRIAQAIKRGKAAYELTTRRLRGGYKTDGIRIDFAHPVSVADVFEAFVMPHMVTRDYQPPQA